MSEALRQRIDGFVASHRVVLFMKGTRRAPQCGFSAQVVQILDELVPDYDTHDVLASAELRDGIKQYSQWPTIPQLYVDGKFIGGCDIVRDLKASGELEQLLAKDAPPLAPPRISASPEALSAFRAAASAGERLHLAVSPGFEHDLYFGPAEPGEVEVDLGGLPLLVPRSSVARAQGVNIGSVDGPGGGFKLDNPNQPPRVVELAAQDARAMLERGELELFDVRPEVEARLASIAQARLLDHSVEYLLSLDRGTPILLHCHHGVRSRSVAESLIQQGFRKVYNLAGGIDAWSQSVDASVPRY